MRIGRRHPERLERDVEGSCRVAVPIREEWYLDPERLCPRVVRPRRVARDPERADAGRFEIVPPVTQEVQLARSGRRPVVDVKAEQREPVAEHVAERSCLLARSRPNGDVRNGAAGLEHRATLAPLGVHEMSNAPGRVRH